MHYDLTEIKLNWTCIDYKSGSQGCNCNLPLRGIVQQETNQQNDNICNNSQTDYTKYSYVHLQQNYG